MNSQKIVIFLVILINRLKLNDTKLAHDDTKSAHIYTGLSDIKKGVINKFASFINIILLPIIGILSAYYGRKNILLMCILTSIFGNILFGNVGNVGKSDNLVLFLNVIFEIMIQMRSLPTYLLVFSVLADISNPINRAKTFGLIGAARVLSDVLHQKLIDSELFNYSLSFVSLINFFIILFFFKGTNINVGIKTNFVEYFKFLSDPMCWSLVLIKIIIMLLMLLLTAIKGLKNSNKDQVISNKDTVSSDSDLLSVYTGIDLIIKFIVQGFLIGPLTNIFHLNQIILFGLICVIISLFVFYFLNLYFLNEQNTNNTISVQKILFGIFSVGTNLVLPCLYALIINKYNYIHYGTILGVVLGLVNPGGRLISILQKLIIYKLDYGISYAYLSQSLLMIASLILFLISKKSGVNLIT